MNRLRDHIQPPVDEARLERQWGAVSAAGLPGAAGHGRRRVVWVLAGALTMAAIGGLVLQLRGSQPVTPKASIAYQPPQAALPAQLPTGALLESEDKEVAVQLSDGSRVALAPRAQMRVRSNQPKVVELELQSGQAHFDVRHDTARRFAIRLGGAEVRVLGTRFDLERQERSDGTFVRVSVREGVVEVQRTSPPSEVARIHASESWSALFPREERAAEPEELPEAQASPRQKTKPQRATTGETDASELFGQATLARRAGRMREAADSYGELLERYPNDPRTGLSAFELGRLRMDALGDEVGAIEALERALKASTSASFREDALARIVVASDALGRTQQCLRARERYDAQYPNGVHSAALAQRCK